MLSVTGSTFCPLLLYLEWNDSTTLTQSFNLYDGCVSLLLCVAKVFVDAFFWVPFTLV